MEKADSITLVLASVKRSCCRTCNRKCFLRPFGQAAGGAGIEKHQFVLQPFQRLLGGSIVFQRVSRLDGSRFQYPTNATRSRPFSFLMMTACSFVILVLRKRESFENGNF